MTDETTQIAGNATPMPESFESAESAAAFMIDRDKKFPAESAEQATAEPELAEANAGPETAPGEEPEGNDQEAEKLPPIERPRSWSKDADDDWNALPRARQEKIAANEREREADHVKRINDTAEKLKGLTAKEQQADEARQKYEAKLPEVMQSLTDHNNRQFADIKSMADLETLANEALRLSATDPVAAGQIQAYLQAWNIHQQKMAATKTELDQANHRKTSKERDDWVAFFNENNTKAEEKIPELADKTKKQAFLDTAGQMFLDVGFNAESLDGFSRGEKISPYHAGMQQIIADAIRYRQSLASKASVTAKVAPKTLPPVQRPGVSRPSGAGNSERIQALESKLNNSGSAEDAFALLMARRDAAARRAS